MDIFPSKFESPLISHDKVLDKYENNYVIYVKLQVLKCLMVGFLIRRATSLDKELLVTV